MVQDVLITMACLSSRLDSHSIDSSYLYLISKKQKIVIMHYKYLYRAYDISLSENQNLITDQLKFLSHILQESTREFVDHVEV